MNIRSTDPVDAYAVAMVKKQQDQDKVMGQQSVRLIDAANAGPQKREPAEGATISVMA